MPEPVFDVLGGDRVRAHFAEASDVTLRDWELDHDFMYDHGGRDDPMRRKRIFNANLLQTCMRFMTACAPRGPQISSERAKALLASGADIHAASADGATPLSLAEAQAQPNRLESYTS